LQLADELARRRLVADVLAPLLDVLAHLRPGLARRASALVARGRLFSASRAQAQTTGP
jgi:hypothetical protein